MQIPMRTAIIDRRRQRRHSDHAKTVCDLALGASGRYYRRFIDMSSRRAAEKSFELSQKRHFWPASKSRARRAPPKTSSGDCSWYVGTPHIVYIKFHIHTAPYAETKRTTSATLLPGTTIVRLSH